MKVHPAIFMKIKDSRKKWNHSDGSGTADGSFHAFLWSWETGIQDLGAIQGDAASVALGLNDHGDITGISFDPDFNPRAFLRLAGGTMVDLNSLIPAGSPLYLFDACSINSSGQIIGIAVDAQGDYHGYLASPVSGPANSIFSSPVNPTGARPSEKARKSLRRRFVGHSESR